MGTVVRKKNKPEYKLPGLVNEVFSWSLADVINKDLYKNEVKQIPDKFSSPHDYLKTFVNPLIEETHADLCSRMTTLSSLPTRQIVAVRKGKEFQLPKRLLYAVTVKSKDRGKKESLYEPNSGDLIALTDVVPKYIDDLNRPKTSYVVAFVESMKEHTRRGRIISSKPIPFRTGDKLYAVYLTNLTTNMRIWNALHTGEGGNKEIIKAVLSYDPAIEVGCTLCLSSRTESMNLSKTVEAISAPGLDDSQGAAVTDCIALAKCHHRNSVKLIWGPPGTGKTKTIASLLCSLLKMMCRTLICAPTNVAVMGVVKRLMDNLCGELKHDTYGLGDLVLFGNGKRMKIDEHEKLSDVFLDNRIDFLAHCSDSSTGWRAVLNEISYLLEYPEYEYQRFLNRHSYESYGGHHLWSFDDFFKTTFTRKRKMLIPYMKGFYTHLPTRLLPMKVLKLIVMALDKLQVLQNLVDSIDITNAECLKNVLIGNDASTLNAVRLDCLHLLNSLLKTLSLPTFKDYFKIKKFCLENACLVFCTVSSSAKLQTKRKKPLELVIIDEAAQLKECESCIPLQLPGVRHAILVGDERQLPAMVTSKICEEAGFGRSLFERLVTLGHYKHLLNVQYRMHPQISLFPKEEFYARQITDGQNVLEKSYEKCFLKENIFGSYLFINITNGKEKFDQTQSLINVVEVHVLAEILSKLYSECTKSNKKVRVGCISPYKAQVFAIQKSLGKTYSTDANDLFSVNVSSVDGFQGGEEDVIIISTVRSNGNGSIGFLSNRQRTNVALTRARYCLWILGNEATLLNSGSVWQKLVLDAKNRGCFYNAYEDKSLSLAIGNVLNEAGQLVSLFSSDSVLFKASKWKIHFGDCKFHESIARIHNVGIRERVAALLVKLSDGWRQQHNPKTISLKEDFPLVEWCDVNERLKLVWTVDILSENSSDTQVIKVLDIVPQSKIPAQAKILRNMASRCGISKVIRCMYKRVEGDLMLPMTWSHEKRGTCPNEGLSKQLAALSFDASEDECR